MTSQTEKREALGRTLRDLHNVGYTSIELSKQYHMTSAAVRGLIRTATLKDSPPEFDAIHLDTPLNLSGDFIIVGDVHVPATDWNFARLVGRVAERVGVRRLIIAGDFFNFDLWSKYQHIVSAPTWHQERDAARVLIADWLDTFDEIYTLQGNHDQRLSKWSSAEFDEEDIWGMVTSNKKLVNSSRGWCTVTSGGVEWRITHPASYRRGQLSVANELANKHQTNIISYHEHKAAQGWDEYEHYVVVNGGMLADPEKMAYVSVNRYYQ